MMHSSSGKIHNTQTALASFIIASVFLAMVTVPFIVTLFSTPQTVSQQENRRLARLPAFSFESLAMGEYQEAFTAYFNDHFGLRETLLKGTKIFRDKLFNKSASRHAIIGENEWLFSTIDGNLRDFIGQSTHDPARYTPLINGLTTKQRWLQQLGVQYLLVPIPGKMPVYPEMLPKRIRKVAGKTRLQMFMEIVKDSPAEPFVLDAMPHLQKAKSEKQIYFKSDTHWNEDGAYSVYVATIQKLNQWFPEVEPIDIDRFTRKPKAKIGDIARGAGFGIDNPEVATTLVLENRCASELYAEIESFTETPAFKERPKALPVTNGCPARSLKALVVHDSFGAYLKQPLSETFGEVVFMPSYDVFGMKAFIQQFQPDIYIDFRVDRRFHYLLGEDPRMLQELNPMPIPDS